MNRNDMNRFRVRAVVALCAISAVQLVDRPARGQQISISPRSDLWVTDGTVNALTESCGVLYIGGTFRYVGPKTGSFAAIDASTAAVETSFPRMLGSVFGVAEDGAGGCYIGGAFTTLEG